ncbi:MAG: lipocalin-like domain-containing protein [Firmicutes bacterium]|nr:lipocalin-like domain-containing protein [Bacillota bacterium]
MGKEAVLGAWRLAHFEYRAADGTAFKPYGEEPLGILIYEPGGYMSGMIGKKGRKNISVEDLGRISEAEKLSLAEGYMAYAGRYEVLDDRVLHSIQASFIPNWIGTQFTRFYRFEEGRLLLQTPPTNFRGRDFVGYLTWERAE